MRRMVMMAVLACAVLVPRAAAQTAEPDIGVPDAGPALHVWTGPDSDDALYQLVGAIAAAGSHGLNPWDYDLIDLLAVPDRPDPGFDRIATQAYLALASDLLQGRVDMDHPIRWPFAPRQRDLDAWLAEALANGDVAASLEALAPAHDDYRALRAALAVQMEIAPDKLPHLIGEGDALETGAMGPRVAALRARLESLGYLAPSSGDTKIPPEEIVFDEAMAQALRQLQRDAHLEEDGVAGAATIAWLDTPNARRIDQLRANLERWRWLPEDFGAHHIRVNLPDYRLQAFDSGAAVRTHDVIIGRPSRASPVLTAAMTHIIANPWWETPHSLAVRDELPLFRRDPAAVSRLGFQIIDRATGTVVDPAGIDWMAVSAANFPYRLRQAPGPLNALGRVKLIFPNPHNTYLHDTPSRALFDRAARAFSSGCVRVRDPVDLANWASVAGGGLDAEALQAAIDSGRETRIDLTSPVQVHFLYFTAFAGADGAVRFVPDVYRRDDAVIAALDQPRERPAPRIESPPDGAAEDGCGPELQAR